MAIQDLDQRFPIIDPKTGKATDYFMRMLKGVTGPTGQAQTDIATLFARNLTAGSGLTGGGTLAADRTFNVGAGTGITVNADDVAIDTTAEAERIRDVIGAALVAGSNITITVSDAGDTITIAGSSASKAWTLIDQSGAATTGSTWTFSTNVAQVDIVGLSSYNDLLVIVRGVSASSSGVRQLLASVNNGSTFYNSSGDYINVTDTGTEVNSTAFAFHNTASTAARSFTTLINNLGGPLPVSNPINLSGSAILEFVASTSRINAIRVNNSGGGNLTSGTIHVFAR